MAKREVTTKRKRWKHGVNTGRELKPKRPRNVLSNIDLLYVDGHVKGTEAGH
jgi:prepilin-type processing-associated H-X9-DG protein